MISEITLEIHKTLTGKHGLRMDQQQFVELNDSVFQKYGLIEEKENRDVADIIKNKEIIDSLFPHRPEEWRQTVAKEIHDAFWSLSYPNWTLRNDARTTLAELSRMGLKMAIVSNHHDTNLSRYLESLGIGQFFSYVVTSMQEGARKPDKRIFIKSLMLLQVQPEEAIFVGDSLKHDIAGARAAGLSSILIADGVSIDSPGGIKPDYTVRNLSEVPGIISRTINGLD